MKCGRAASPQPGDLGIAHHLSEVYNDAAADDKRVYLASGLQRLELPNLARMDIRILDARIAGVTCSVVGRHRAEIVGAATDDTATLRELARDQ